MSSLFSKKDPIQDKNNNLNQMRRERRQSLISGFTLDSNLTFRQSFDVSQHEKIFIANGLPSEIDYNFSIIPLYFNGKSFYYINGEECPKLPINNYKDFEQKKIIQHVIFKRQATNEEYHFNNDFEYLRSKKSATIKKYKFTCKNVFGITLLNKIKEAIIKPETKTLTYTYKTKSNEIPFRSYKKLSSLYDDFDTIKYKNVNHYNDFNVKEAKDDYSLRTYSKYKYTFIGDIFFESNKAAFLLLINVNTRYAYAYQLGKVTMTQGKNENEFEIKYSTQDKKSIKPLTNAFDEHLKICPINILRFDGEKAINSKEFKNYFKSKNIKLIPARTEAHTSLSLIDRLCRTIRDIAFNLNLPGIYHQKDMNDILDYYNKSRHETLTKTLFKAYPELKHQFKFISPAIINNSDLLETKYVEECMKHNFNVVSNPDYKLKQNDTVKITSEKSKLGKKRTIIDKDLYKINKQEGNIYELINTKTGTKVYKPRFEIKNFI